MPTRVGGLYERRIMLAEIEIWREAITLLGGNIAQIAQSLGKSRQYCHKRLSRLGLREFLEETRAARRALSRRRRHRAG